MRAGEEEGGAEAVVGLDLGWSGHFPCWRGKWTNGQKFMG